MMRAVKIFVAFFSLFVATVANAESDCFCGEDSFYYRVTDSRDEAALWEYPWAVVDIEPVFDLNLPGEPIVTCLVTIDLVTEDRDEERGGNFEVESWQQIFYGGRWTPIAEFEVTARLSECGAMLMM